MMIQLNYEGLLNKLFYFSTRQMHALFIISSRVIKKVFIFALKTKSNEGK